MLRCPPYWGWPIPDGGPGGFIFAGSGVQKSLAVLGREIEHAWKLYSPFNFAVNLVF